MSKERIDLTTKQTGENGFPNTPIYLPALSSFYSGTLGKHEQDPAYTPQSRLPVGFENGLAGLNWLDKNNGYFYYKWMLYSAGHANIDVNKPDAKENMVRMRDRTDSFVLGDSGGFQIGKGVWEGDWKNPACPKAMKKRQQVLTWMDSYMDYGMALDIPVWACKNPDAAKKIGIASYQDAVDATQINNDYFIKHRTGACKFLNVLQGENFTEANDWYNTMKKYCDPKQYPDHHFDGWAMGGQSVTDPELILNRLVDIVYDGLLQQGKHDWLHFLGLGKLPWACFFTDVQAALRKYHNPNVTISFDSASPFLMVANGGIYVHMLEEDRGRWTTVMDGSVDDKKYSADTRLFSEVLKENRGYKKFDESPISLRMQGKDVCIYKPGDLNRIGKEGKTSWDVLSYVFQMGHNVFAHVDSVQRAIESYLKNDKYPKQLIDERFELITTKDLVDKIFAASTREEAKSIIQHNTKFWGKLSGSRGFKGNKTTNATTKFAELFTEEAGTQGPEIEEDLAELSEYDGKVDKNLANLELGLDN